MPVDRGRDGGNQALGDVLLPAGVSDNLLLLVCELHNVFVSLALQVVDLNDGLEDGEAVLNVREIVISVDVNAMNFDFISWSSNIDKIVKNKDLLLSGYTSRGHSTWRLLYCELLVVAIDGSLLIHGEWAICLAHNTATEFLLCLLGI